MASKLPSCPLIEAINYGGGAGVGGRRLYLWAGDCHLVLSISASGIEEFKCFKTEWKG